MLNQPRQEYENDFTAIRIEPDEFIHLTGLIHQNFGIHLNESKKSLIEGRFQKILKKYRLRNFKEYLNFLYLPGEDIHGKLGELIDRISTNHTFFHREAIHFDKFEKQILPEIKQKNSNSRKIRVWCAASSYGQEPYTLMMRMQKCFGSEYKNWDLGLLATDISEDALRVAESGIYEARDVLQLPPEWVRFGFQKINDDCYKVQDHIRSEVLFRRFNLMNALPFKSNFDIVFCRNVMIYFDDPTKEALVKRIYNKMNVGGYFIVSLSESLKRDTCPFTYISPGVYKKI